MSGYIYISFLYFDPINKQAEANLMDEYAELDIPEYESYEILRSQVLKAITAGSDYFGFA